MKVAMPNAASGYILSLDDDEMKTLLSDLNCKRIILTEQHSTTHGYRLLIRGNDRGIDPERTEDGTWLVRQSPKGAKENVLGPFLTAEVPPMSLSQELDQRRLCMLLDFPVEKADGVEPVFTPTEEEPEEQADDGHVRVRDRRRKANVIEQPFDDEYSVKGIEVLMTKLNDLRARAPERVQFALTPKGYLGIKLTVDMTPDDKEYP